MVTVAVGVLFLHFRLSPILTASMKPAYGPGDAIITREVDVRSIAVGQIALFVPPGETAEYAHRVTTVTGDRVRPTVTTKGDANPVADQWHSVLPGPRAPVVVATVPKLGYLLIWLRGPVLRALLVAAFGLTITFVGTSAILRRSGSTQPITPVRSA